MVVRYLTHDVPDLADQAAAIIDGEEDLWIIGVVLAETDHVLRSVYGIPRENVADWLIGFVQKKNIRTHGVDKSLVVQGLLMCRQSARVSFADALIWATARSAGSNVVYSLDLRFPSQDREVRQAP
ncbi:MAG: VapC toxin family PIN domain ribonuclease [SAR202 cluster bacterium Io17-Chloro-G9]|nr:MAG: VapC toxin family PIN domain ribonuclease [SAR202 cluster bacterium Io17-Chloro-G9]